MSFFLKLLPPIYEQGEGKRGTRVFLCIAWMIYAAVTLWTTIHHEPWRDEAYVWVMARDLDFLSLFQELRYNGSPGLWHSLVFLLTRAGFPYAFHNYFHWALGVGTAGFFLLRSPFHALFKISLVFSYFFLYEHIVIARVYLISILLLYLSADLYPQKLEKPLRYSFLIFLLANSNFFGLVAAAYLGADFLIAVIRLKNWSAHYGMSVLGMLLGGIISAASIFPPSDALFYHSHHFSFFYPSNLAFGFANSFLRTDFVTTPTLCAGALCGLAIFGLTARVLWQNQGKSALGLLSTLWMVILYIGVFKYRWPGPRHYSFFLIFVVVTLWMSAPKRNKTPSCWERFLCCILITTFVPSFLSARDAIRQELSALPYSASVPMQQFLRESGLIERAIVGYPSSYAPTVLPFFPGKKIWYPQIKAFGTFVHFDKDSQHYLSYAEVANLAGANLSDPANLIFLFGFPIPENEACNFKLIKSIAAIREPLWLYQLADGTSLPVSGCPHTALPTVKS